MALILTDATFEDKEGLAKLVELYKRSSITSHALSTELTTAAQEIIAFGNEIFIEIVEGKAGDRTFGIAILPKPTETKMDLYFYVDKQLLSILTAEQFLDALVLELKNYSQVTTEFARFNSKTFDFDVDLIDALVEAIKLYKISLNIILTLPDISDNMKSMFISTEVLDSVIDELEKHDYSESEAEELVTIKNCLPSKIIEAAKDIVRNSRNIYNKSEGKTQSPFGTKYDEPDRDFYFNRTKELTNNTYPLYQPQDIDPDYEPESNQ